MHLGSSRSPLTEKNPPRPRPKWGEGEPWSGVFLDLQEDDAAQRLSRHVPVQGRNNGYSTQFQPYLMLRSIY